MHFTTMQEKMRSSKKFISPTRGSSGETTPHTRSQSVSSSSQRGTYSSPPSHELLILVLILCNFLSAYYTAFCIEASTKRYHWFYKRLHATDLSWYAVWYSCQTLALLVSMTNVMVIWAMGVRCRAWALKALTGFVRRGSIGSKNSDSEKEKTEESVPAGWVVGGEGNADEEVVGGDRDAESDEDEGEEVADEDEEVEEVEEFEGAVGKRRSLGYPTPSPYISPAAPSWRQIPVGPAKYTTTTTISSSRRSLKKIHHHHHHHYHAPPNMLPMYASSPYNHHHNHNPTCPFSFSSFLGLLKLRIGQVSDTVGAAWYQLSGGKKTRRMCGAGLGRRKAVRVMTAAIMLAGVGVAAWNVGLGPFWLTMVVQVKRTDRAIMIPWNG